MDDVAKLLTNIGGEGAIRNADDGDCWPNELLLGDEGAAEGVEISMGETVADAEACDDCCCWADRDEVDEDGVGPPDGRDVLASSAGAGVSSSIALGVPSCACSDVDVGNKALSAGRVSESTSMAVDVDGGTTAGSASHICSIGSFALT